MSFLSCKQNICLLCKPKHDSNHNIIKYDQKNYICPKHNDFFIKYCEDCNINMCFSCGNDHSQHKAINLMDIIPDIEQSKKRLKEIKSEIDILTNQVNEIINQLNKFLEVMNTYYEMNNTIIKKYEVKNRNYQILKNINEINNNDKINEKIKKINQHNDIIDKKNKRYNRFI